LARLIYMVITSLDGYIEDDQGRYDWGRPDDEVLGFVNDFERPVGTCLYGRRLYEEMTGWETADAQPGQPPLMLDFARIWQAADKVVYSRTLDRVSTARTRIERHFDPEAVRQMKAQADRDITVGGPELAAHAIRAGLVDDYHLLISPVVVGNGKAALPGDVRLPLELVDERRFGNGVVHLHYRDGQGHGRHDDRREDGIAVHHRPGENEQADADRHQGEVAPLVHPGRLRSRRPGPARPAPGRSPPQSSSMTRVFSGPSRQHAARVTDLNAPGHDHDDSGA
jgi:dihydrofolate reductase